MALFVPCFVEHLQADVALATARLLDHLGHEVVLPAGQTCCGQAALNAGLADAARVAARHFLSTFRSCVGERADAIVCPSGSCTAMVRTHYRALLSPEELGAYETIAARLFEFTEFVVDELGVRDVGARWNGRVALHRSCHALRRLGIARQPLALLEHLAGAEVVELGRPEACCGFGGVFATKLPEVSARLADDKLDDAIAAGAEVLTGVDSSCLGHLAARASRRKLGLRCVHVAPLLAEGVGLL